MGKFANKYNNKEVKVGQRTRQKKFRRGAASFYIVAMATLILGIIAASFATVVISQVTRSANDDLKASATDAALAGIEDGKLAHANYQRCKNALANGQDTSSMQMSNHFNCDQLINWEDNGVIPDGIDERDMVPNAIGREVVQDPETNEKLGVSVQGSSGDENMQQFYTYVKVETQTEDVLGTINSERPARAFRLKFRGDNMSEAAKTAAEGALAQQNGSPNNSARVSTLDSDDIDKIRVSWHSTTEDSDSKNGLAFTWMNTTDFGGIFSPSLAVPAVVQLSVVQTGENFTFSEFDECTENCTKTNRGTITMVPTYEKTQSSTGSVDTGAGQSYVQAYDSSSGTNQIPADSGLAKSNDKSYKNLPFLVYCDYKMEYACSAEIGLPRPVGNEKRSDQTFVVALSLPYAQPQTHFSLEFLSGNEPAVLDGVQVRIDSTGRANDVFSRLDSRLESSEAAYPYPLMALEVLGNSKIEKTFYSACEYDLTDITSTDGHGCLNNPTH